MFNWSATKDDINENLSSHHLMEMLFYGIFKYIFLLPTELLEIITTSLLAVLTPVGEETYIKDPLNPTQPNSTD